MGRDDCNSRQPPSSPSTPITRFTALPSHAGKGGRLAASPPKPSQSERQPNGARCLLPQRQARHFHFPVPFGRPARNNVACRALSRRSSPPTVSASSGTGNGNRFATHQHTIVSGIPVIVTKRGSVLFFGGSGDRVACQRVLYPSGVCECVS